MKTLTLMFLISISYNMYAQKSIFVRVFDLSGKKINKGHVFTVTDTSLQLKGKSVPVNIPVRSIGFIKTKHSAGNNVLIGSIVGVSSLAILGVASAEPDAEIAGYTALEGAGAGAIVGLPVGAVIGGLTSLFKNSKSYLINGDVTKWKAFQLTVTGNNVK
jgi:hypothetical protein